MGKRRKILTVEEVKKMANDDGGSSFVSGFLIGGIIGTVVGILLAPRSGLETRSELLDQSEEFRERTEEILARLRERLEPTVESMREQFIPVAERFAKGSENVVSKFASSKVSKSEEIDSEPA